MLRDRIKSLKKTGKYSTYVTKTIKLDKDNKLMEPNIFRFTIPGALLIYKIYMEISLDCDSQNLDLIKILMYNNEKYIDYSYMNFDGLGLCLADSIVMQTDNHRSNADDFSERRRLLYVPGRICTCMLNGKLSHVKLIDNSLKLRIFLHTTPLIKNLINVYAIVASPCDPTSYIKITEICPVFTLVLANKKLCINSNFPYFLVCVNSGAVVDCVKYGNTSVKVVKMVECNWRKIYICETRDILPEAYVHIVGKLIKFKLVYNILTT